MLVLVSSHSHEHQFRPHDLQCQSGCRRRKGRLLPVRCNLDSSRCLLLGVTDQQLPDVQVALLDGFFTARNAIAHELDYRDTTGQGTARNTRRIEDVRDQCEPARPARPRGRSPHADGGRRMATSTATRLGAPGQLALRAKATAPFAVATSTLSRPQRVLSVPTTATNRLRTRGPTAGPSATLPDHRRGRRHTLALVGRHGAAPGPAGLGSASSRFSR
jgi:hypothetical protein